MKNALTAVIVTAATARLTALIAQDEITNPIRDRLEDWSRDAPEGSFKERVTFLVNCTHCVSVWAAAGILLTNAWPRTRPVVVMLAASQAAISTLALIEMVERQ